MPEQQMYTDQAMTIFGVLNCFSDRATVVDLETYQQSERSNVICSEYKETEKQVNKDAILSLELWK